MNKNIINKIAKTLQLETQQIQKTLELIADGSTVAFISRYRKEFTNGLDEEEINNIANLYKYMSELNERKQAIINLLKERNLLNADLENKILNVDKKSDLEAIYEPFKLGKKSKANDAILLGLEPLAKEIFTNKDINFNVYNYAKKFLNNKVQTIEFAIENALFIVSQ